MPTMDASQDQKKLIEGYRVGNGNDVVTVFVFQRPLISCDVQEDYNVYDREKWIIYAFGETDTFAYHSANRGSEFINLLSIEEPVVDTTVYSELSIRTPTHDISPERTTYICSKHALPNNTKYHAVRIEPIIDHPDLVHHMIMYHCLVEPDFTGPGKCRSVDMSANCRANWSGWAKGAGTNIMPEFAGLPFGAGDNGTNPTYIMLQIHYDNVNAVSGLQDTSGFKISYTDNLRQHDIGLLVLIDYEFVIPANTGNHAIENQCPSVCTSQHIPAEGINVLNTFFHMHNLGAKAYTQQIRNGVELEPLGYMEQYDFNRQDVSAPPRGRKIMPGDSLHLHCEWDSSSRSENVTWGEASNEEMCINYISYYPRVNTMEICTQSNYTLTGVRYSLGICAPYKEASNLRNLDIPRWLANGWLNIGVNIQASGIDYTPYTEICNPLVQLGGPIAPTTPRPTTTTIPSSSQAPHTSVILGVLFSALVVLL